MNIHNNVPRERKYEKEKHFKNQKEMKKRVKKTARENEEY